MWTCSWRPLYRTLGLGARRNQAAIGNSCAQASSAHFAATAHGSSSSMRLLGWSAKRSRTWHRYQQRRLGLRPALMGDPEIPRHAVVLKEKSFLAASPRVVG